MDSRSIELEEAGQVNSPESHRGNNHDVLRVSSRADESVEKKQISEIQNSVYIKRLICYWSRDKAEMPKGSTFIKPVVKSFVDELVDHVKKRNSIFSAEKLTLVGSVSENTKISVPDEFDFLWEMKIPDKEKLQITQVYPDTFKPRHNAEIRPRMYFKLKFKKDTQNGLLEARKVQEGFKSVLQEAINNHQAREKYMVISMNGPAVTISLELTEETSKNFLKMDPGKEHKWKEMATRKKPLRIKIDITLAIRVKKNDLRLNRRDNADVTVEEEEDLYLVPSGDFWSLSCTNLEILKMQKMSAREIHCYRALKYLRDKFEINVHNKGPTSILGTYPLKISFMKAIFGENAGELPNNIEELGFHDLGIRLVDVLKDVEDKGQDGSLTSYFVKNEPILRESDKCYVESRRIIQHLVGLNESYLYHGRVHTFLILFFLTCCGVLFGRCVYGIMVFTPSQRCVISSTPVHPLLSFYMFWHLPLALLMFIEKTLCCIGVFMLRRLWHDKKPLYDMYKGIIYVYIAFWFISMVLLGIGIALAVLYRRTDDCTSPFAFSLHSLMVSTAVITLLPLVYTGVHLAVTCFEMRCQCSKFENEWIFFDRLWQDCCYKFFTYETCRKNCCKYSDRYYRST